MLDRFEAFVSGINICYKFIQKIKSTEMTLFGLKGTHVMCIYFLSKHPDGLTAAELSRLCAEDKAAISRTLSALSAQGYVFSAEKKYRDNITLTPKGKELAVYVQEHIRRWVDCGGTGLSEEEREIFYKSLSVIASNLALGLNNTTDTSKG